MDGRRPRQAGPRSTADVTGPCTDLGKSGKRRGHAGEDGFPMPVGSGADRGHRQAGGNETVSGAPTPRALVTIRDEVGRLRAAAHGRERADSDDRQHLPGLGFRGRPPQGPRVKSASSAESGKRCQLRCHGWSTGTVGGPMNVAGDNPRSGLGLCLRSGPCGAGDENRTRVASLAERRTWLGWQFTRGEGDRDIRPLAVPASAQARGGMNAARSRHGRLCSRVPVGDSRCAKCS